MSQGYFKQTGVAETLKAIEEFPEAETAALKAVAKVNAGRIHARARLLLAQQTHGEGNTAAALKVSEDAPNRQFVVEFGLIRNRPAMLPVWIELGTVRMNARPFMRPAADAFRDKYRAEMAMASEVAARKTFK